MRRKMYWRATIFVAAAVGVNLGSSLIDLGVVGISSAEAKSYYTRKRVNGRWITGIFPKQGATNTEAAAEAGDTERKLKVSAVPTKITAATAAAAPASKPAPAPAPKLAPALASKPAPVLASKPAPVPASAPVLALPAPPVAAPAPTVARVAPAQVAVALPPVPPANIPAAAPLVPHPEDERLLKLREALQARANALTSTTGSIAAPRPPEPQSVSLDFQSGIKTTIFSDGTSIREHFDVGALKGIAAVPPRARSGL